MAKQKLSDAETNALLQWLTTLQPVEPTATIGNVSPDTRKPNTGFKRFMVGPAGQYSDLANPKWWAGGLAREADRNLIEPVLEASKMKWADPSSGLSPTERLAQLMGDALVVGSTVVPAAKGVSTGMSLLDDLARLNQSRYMYGVHFSPTANLDEINVAANEMKRKWVDSEVGTNYFFDTANLNPRQIQTMDRYLQLYSKGENEPTAYFIKTPKKGIKADANYGDADVMLEVNEGKIPFPSDTRKGKKVWDSGQLTSETELPDETYFWDYEMLPTNAKNTPNKLKVVSSKKISGNYPDNQKEFVDFMNNLVDSTPSGRFWLQNFLKTNKPTKLGVGKGVSKTAAVKGKKVPK